MSDAQAKPKRKRRWLTYSLRTFFLMVTIGCVTVGYWAHCAEKQKAVAEWVRANGGKAYYGYQVDENNKPIEAPERPYPDWAHTVLGDDYLFNVIAVSMNSDDLEEIAPWRRSTTSGVYISVPPKLRI